MITHGMRHSSIWTIWRNMRVRCHDSKDKNYLRYGARGISVSKRWMKFENFYKDMGDRPTGFSLDRINNEKGYSKSNCRWANNKTQARNRRSNKIIQYKGKSKCLAQWAEDLGLRYETLHKRIYYGWSIQKTFETPIRFHREYKKRNP